MAPATTRHEGSINPHMNAITSAPVGTPPAADRTLFAGCILSGIVVLFLLLDSTMKLFPLQVVTDTMIQLGWPINVGLVRTLGIVLLASALLYCFPSTALLGAILITAYLGGAVAAHVRIGSPLFTHTLFGVYIGLLTWAGLWLREPRLRALLTPMPGLRR